MMHNKWVIFDLDGTIADISQRLHYINPISPHDEIEKFKPDWESFNLACDKDEPKHEIVELLRLVQRNGNKVAIFSGRMDTAKTLTEEWFNKHGITCDVLEMRKEGDYRSDVVVKREMFDRHFTVDQVWFAIDDRDKVVDLWRELGLTTLQCQKGDY